MPPAGEVTIVGEDPYLPCRFPVAETAAGVLAAIGVAVNDLWEQIIAEARNLLGGNGLLLEYHVI